MDLCAPNIRGPAWQSAVINVLLSRESVLEALEGSHLPELARNADHNCPRSSSSPSLHSQQRLPRSQTPRRSKDCYTQTSVTRKAAGFILG